MASDDLPSLPPFEVIPGKKNTGSDQRTLAANDEQILRDISRLELDHHDLDLAITAIEGQGIHDRLSLMRLKKKKLAVKDEIARLKSSLEPDIIA